MMASVAACSRCGCGHSQGAVAHAIVAALADDNLDQAIELGLLGTSTCTQCDPACSAHLQQAREARLGALAARERYRARQARLQRRAEAAKAKRTPPQQPATALPALPSAAAAALARAKARAAGQRPT